MKNKILRSWFKKLVAALVMTFFVVTTAYAGFGISPPYVANEHLSPGFPYEQKIILVRGDPVEDLKAEIMIDVPEADKWISIDKGREFIMPKGETQVPILVKVDVPRGAELKQYKGKIQIKTSSLISSEGGTVGVALGGQIDVNLVVTDEKIFDFKVSAIEVKDLETAHEWLFWTVPGVVEFKMQLENLGNVPASPSKIALNIHDSNGEELLEEFESVDMDMVDPFEIKWITVDVPTSLLPGGYWAKYDIYKEDEVIKNGEVHLSIMPYGTLPDAYHTPYAEFLRMNSGDQIQFILLCLLLLLILNTIVFFTIYKITSRRKKELPTDLPIDQA
jgi:hypothetical protein